MAIYASLVHGLDLHLWGAFGFSHESVRNKLQHEMAPGDFMLSIGTAEHPTPDVLQGKLLALMRLDRRQVRTIDYVEPEHWEQHLIDYGRARWPHAMPIIEAEVFEPLPSKDEILPRIREKNLHRKLATNYEKLTPEEEARVLSLPRKQASDIYRGKGSSFYAATRRSRPGPPPSTKPRTGRPSDGPAATYLMKLEGSHARQLARRPDHTIYKIGFSRDPQARLRDLNCFYPKPELLHWKVHAEQWHVDALNAYAMEQHAIASLSNCSATHLVGEIYEGRLADAESAFSRSARDTVRPGEDSIAELPVDLMY